MGHHSKLFMNKIICSSLKSDVIALKQTFSYIVAFIVFFFFLTEMINVDKLVTSCFSVKLQTICPIYPFSCFCEKRPKVNLNCKRIDTICSKKKNPKNLNLDNVVKYPVKPMKISYQRDKWTLRTSWFKIWGKWI